MLSCRVAAIGLCGGSGRLNDLEEDIGRLAWCACPPGAWKSSGGGGGGGASVGDSGGDPSGDVGSERESFCVVCNSGSSSGTVPSTAAAALLRQVSTTQTYPASSGNTYTS